jgi:hypothetical protein
MSHQSTPMTIGVMSTYGPREPSKWSDMRRR